MNAEPERRTDKKRTWPVWVGSLDELRRLSAKVEQIADDRGRLLLADFDQQTKLELAAVDEKHFDSDMPPDREILTQEQIDEVFRQTAIQGIEQSRAAHRLDLVKRLTVVTTLTDGDDTTSGDSEQVLSELDRRSVKSVEFATQSYDEQIKLILGEGKERIRKTGAVLQVSSIDRGWGNQAFVQLSEEIAKGVPRYSWIRSGLGRLALQFWIAILPALALVLIILPSAHSNAQDGAVWFGGFWLAFALAIFLVVPDWFINWLVPRFEVIGEDNQSKGWRRISAAIAPVLAVVLGIIVNRLYS